MGIRRKSKKIRLVHLCLAVPFIALTWIGFYDRVEPNLAGIPFFYWYQLLWIPLGALLILPVYLSEERSQRRDSEDRASRDSTS